MKSVSIGTSVTPIATAGRRTDALELYNNGTATIFLQYDGSDAASTPVTLTADNGMPFPAASSILIDSRWAKYQVNGITSAGTIDVRVQGDDA